MPLISGSHSTYTKKLNGTIFKLLTCSYLNLSVNVNFPFFMTHLDNLIVEWAEQTQRCRPQGLMLVLGESSTGSSSETRHFGGKLL